MYILDHSDSHEYLQTIAPRDVCLMLKIKFYLIFKSYVSIMKENRKTKYLKLLLIIINNAKIQYESLTNP